MGSCWLELQTIELFLCLTLLFLTVKLFLSLGIEPGVDPMISGFLSTAMGPHNIQSCSSCCCVLNPTYLDN